MAQAFTIFIGRVAVVQMNYLSTFAVVFCASTTVYAQETRTFSAPARIEGAAPAIKMAFNIAGTVKVIHARAGEAKKLGDPLISLQCDDRSATIRVASSDAQEAQALLEKARNGLRAEERAVVAERVKVGETDVAAAERRYQRFEQLKQKGNFISDAELDTMRDALSLARAKNQGLIAEQKLAAVPARREDIAAAVARVAAAQARLAFANAEAEKCTFRAPSNIVVLRNFVEVGDSINPLNPLTLGSAMTVADLSRLRVRAEVDERDVSFVKLGQRVNIISEFDKSLQLVGTVALVQAEMGRRSIKSGDASDKNDRDVLEVVIDLGPTTTLKPKLPIGMRVVAVFGR